jgi:hypothetical protein
MFDGSGCSEACLEIVVMSLSVTLHGELEVCYQSCLQHILIKNYLALPLGKGW